MMFVHHCYTAMCHKIKSDINYYFNLYAIYFNSMFDRVYIVYNAFARACTLPIKVIRPACVTIGSRVPFIQYFDILHSLVIYVLYIYF